MKRIVITLLWVPTIGLFFLPSCWKKQNNFDTESATAADKSPTLDCLLAPPVCNEINLSPPPACDARVNYCMKLAVNTETYQKISENTFKSSRSNPLSTFSIDVDGASYSNVRKKLMAGNLPEIDAVRIEEFINYFNYSYPAPTGDKPFSISTEYAKCPWNEKHTLLQIGVKGKTINPISSPANNLVFLIDVSGSMDQPDKLPLLKRAFRLLIPQLRPQDKISLVVYAGNAGMIIDGISGDQKLKLTEAISQLEAGGSTAGGQGINLAYALAKKHFLNSGNNRVILATDGDFNVGVSEDSELEKLITSKRDEGIYLSVLGFGQGNIKDSKMETLADKGNGNYNFIDNILEARKVLVTQFGGTLSTIAKDVKIQIEFNPAKVKEYRLIGYENRLLNDEDFNDDKKDAGELGSGHCVTALYEIIPATGDDSQAKVDDLKYVGNSTSTSYIDLATVKFRYKGVQKSDTTSKLISKVIYPVVRPADKVSANMKLASSAAELAMLLRNSEDKGKSSYANALSLAKQAKGLDTEGYVSGLIDMISVANQLQLVSQVMEK